MKQLYRIVSDISTQYEIKETSFCIKVINGVVLTYTGIFKEWQPSTSLCEIHASLIGLTLVEPHLNPGDTVIIHSDTTELKHVKSIKNPIFRDLVKRLWKNQIHVIFDGVKKNASERYVHNVATLYKECHKQAGVKLKNRLVLYRSEDGNDKFKESQIWGNIKSKRIMKIYLSKSNRANPEIVSKIRKSLEGYEVSEYEKGTDWSDKPILAADAMVLIPEYLDHHIIGKGLAGEINSFLPTGNPIYIVKSIDPIMVDKLTSIIKVTEEGKRENWLQHSATFTEGEPKKITEYLPHGVTTG